MSSVMDISDSGNNPFSPSSRNTTSVLRHLRSLTASPTSTTHLPAGEVSNSGHLVGTPANSIQNRSILEQSPLQNEGHFNMKIESSVINSAHLVGTPANFQNCSILEQSPLQNEGNFNKEIEGSVISKLPNQNFDGEMFFTSFDFEQRNLVEIPPCWPLPGGNSEPFRGGEDGPGTRPYFVEEPELDNLREWIQSCGGAESGPEERDFQVYGDEMADISRPHCCASISPQSMHLDSGESSVFESSKSGRLSILDVSAIDEIPGPDRLEVPETKAEDFQTGPDFAGLDMQNTSNLLVSSTAGLVLQNHSPEPVVLQSTIPSVTHDHVQGVFPSSFIGYSDTVSFVINEPVEHSIQELEEMQESAVDHEIREPEDQQEPEDRQEPENSLPRPGACHSQSFNIPVLPPRAPIMDVFSTGTLALNMVRRAALMFNRAENDMAWRILKRVKSIIVPHSKDFLHRVSFYFMKALLTKISGQLCPFATKTMNSRHGMLEKMQGGKLFYEVSPIPKFAIFTANQTILEATEGEELVHVITFEVGLGLQWSTFLEDVATRATATGKPRRMRLTAVVGSRTLEVEQTGENLCNVAKDLDLSLDFRVVSCSTEKDLLSTLDLIEGEAVAVNFVHSLHRLLVLRDSCEALNTVLRVVREAQPKVVTVVEVEANHNHSGFYDRFGAALQYYMLLFASLNETAKDQDSSFDKVVLVEEFLLAPQIFNILLCEGDERIRRHEKLEMWRSRFANAGFHALPMSDRSAMMAGLILPGRLTDLEASTGGFDIIKDRESLLLSWAGSPLMSTSAWTC